MMEIAVQIVQKAFANKLDRAGKPYIEHLERLSQKVPDLGILKEVKTIALLHDLLEDCSEWSEKSLREIFSDNIVDSVVALTRKPNQSYEDFIEQVCQDKWATIVKKADLEDNMDITRLESFSDEDFQRLEKYNTAYRQILMAL